MLRHSRRRTAASRIASGTDLAVNAAPVTLYHSDLCVLPWAVELSRDAVRAVNRNLLRALLQPHRSDTRRVRGAASGCRGRANGRIEPHAHFLFDAWGASQEPNPLQPSSEEGRGAESSPLPSSGRGAGG